MKKRTIAIVGRPNVGKSAIFNRIVGRRLAIVHEQSGTTRDRLMAEAAWQDRRFTLIDTGGIINMDRARIGSTIEAGVRKQVDEALEDAAAVIFVVDVQFGMTPMDEYVAGILHSVGVPVALAANKADGPQMDAQADEFRRFGFPVFPVSAFHDRGFDPLLEEVVPKLPAAGDAGISNPLKVAVVGRPNVGKSSYINRLLRDERVIVSEIPGTTRDSVEVPFTVGSGPQARHYLLIDTAGMRKADKKREGLDFFSLLRTEKAIERADVVIVVTDAFQGMTVHDQKIVGEVLKAEKGCIVLANKWDLVTCTKKEFLHNSEFVLRAMSFVPLVFVSSKSGENIRQTVEWIDNVAAQIKTEFPTAVLNKVISTAYEKTPPPMVRGSRLKIFYSTQTGTAPLRITMFVNDPEKMRPAFQHFLERTLRDRFGLDGAPIVFKLKSRPQRKE